MPPTTARGAPSRARRPGFSTSVSGLRDEGTPGGTWHVGHSHVARSTWHTARSHVAHGTSHVARHTWHVRPWHVLGRCSMKDCWWIAALIVVTQAAGGPPTKTAVNWSDLVTRFEKGS